MVPTLRSSERNLGLRAAEAIRERMGGDFMMRELWIVPKTDIENALDASGYSRIEALNDNDAKQLANLLRAEEYLSGTITPANGGYQFDGTVMLVRGDGMVQPMPQLTDPKIDGLAKKISGEIDKARKPLTSIQACMLNWRQNKHPDAIREAQKALVMYPNSVMARVCMLETYNTQKLGADSIIKVSEEIIKIHPTNRRALSLVADAYNEKKMENEYISTLTKLLTADPTNTRLQETVVTALAQAGKPEVARPIIEEAVKQNPGDPSLIRLQWRIYLTLRDYKQATAIGEEMIKTDTAAADTSFFIRMAGAYVADSQPQKAAEIAARGANKFTQNAGLWLLYAQFARQTGQAPQALEAINKALAIDPKVENGFLQKAQIFNEMNQPDSAFATLRQAQAAGTAKATVGAMALSIANNSYYKKCNETKTIEDCERAIGPIALADSLSPSTNAKFLLGATYLLVGHKSIEGNVEAKSCDVARKAKDALVNAQILVPQGAQAFPQQAGQLMQALAQLDPYADRQIQAFCKSR
jgi:tetratricopeptide (TPR) repeat protein